jgi:hypothetical protein
MRDRLIKESGTIEKKGEREKKHKSVEQAIEW